MENLYNVPTMRFEFSNENYQADPYDSDNEYKGMRNMSCLVGDLPLFASHPHWNEATFPDGRYISLSLSFSFTVWFALFSLSFWPSFADVPSNPLSLEPRLDLKPQITYTAPLSHADSIPYFLVEPRSGISWGGSHRIQLSVQGALAPGLDEVMAPVLWYRTESMPLSLSLSLLFSLFLFLFLFLSLSLPLCRFAYHRWTHRYLVPSSQSSKEGSRQVPGWSSYVYLSFSLIIPM